MKTYNLIAKNREVVSVYSDDTFTFALGSPEIESEESTPQMLADIFPVEELERLPECAKRDRAIEIATRVA
jgi:hypothetical protein